MASRVFRVATRASMLALTQTKQTVALLEKAIRPMRSSLLRSVHRVMPKPEHTGRFRRSWCFCQELETALRENRADLAIHSLKDVPSSVADGMTIASFPSRVDPSDVVMTVGGLSLYQLAPGARVGTGSPAASCSLKQSDPICNVRDPR